MNFIEFYENVTKMKDKLMKDGADLNKTEVIHTKSSGENILAAIYGENLLDYFKW